MKEKLLNILTPVFIIIFVVPIFIYCFIIWCIYTLSGKTNKLFCEFSSSHWGNTEYELTCPDCGYSNKMWIGGGHDFEEDRGYFVWELAYCPKCKEPLPYSSHTNGKNKTTEVENDKCPICGRKTKTYNRHFPKKLVCPKCKSKNLKIINTESSWMT